AQTLTQDKAEIIGRFQKDGKTVMMVGDGINDAPALAAADIGCAIGGGSDIAIESADIVLMKKDISDVPRAVHLSRLTMRNIKQNLFWAFCYNSVGIPIAAGALYWLNGMLLSPMLAGLAMSLSSVCVVTNALRLGRKKP
ncbi:MAG: HAD-IC family P-type ATPase, partial [Clostridiales bacterium]|nr:HAD-IC family P-type ATPase [Clostridiales bacterium]